MEHLILKTILILIGLIPIALGLSIIVFWLYTVVLWVTGKNTGYEYINGASGKRKGINPFPGFLDWTDKINDRLAGIIATIIYIILIIITFNTILFTF